MKRKVDVTLLGRRFTVKTEKDEAYVHALAAQVSRRLDDVRRQVRGASIEEQALLVAMGLADELAEERERAHTARAEIRARTEAMVKKLSVALSFADRAAGANGAGSADGDGETDVEHEVALALPRQI
jgi:cell division protein ZapA (FtsZ GTPase activity inhibitor)